MLGNNKMIYLMIVVLFILVILIINSFKGIVIREGFKSKSD